MLELLEDIQKCTGCTACFNVCHRSAISMAPDKLGFLYPKIDTTKCVDCGLCVKVCPKTKPLHYELGGRKVAYGISKREEVLMSSSSGGAFSELIHAVERKKIKFHCYAVEYNNGKVFHSCLSSSSQLSLFKKSKYTQSDLTNVFQKIKIDLSQGVFVIFVGTPCQVDGLNSFLNYKTNQNLLTIDLLCTGTCSPILLKNHVAYLERNKRKEIKEYDMRHKEYINNKWHIMNTKILYSDGVREIEEDKYFIGCFRQHVAFRESCYQCKYTSTKRPADITLGDYWKEDRDISNGGFKGVSVVCANTKYGVDWINELSETMLLKNTNIDDIVSQQPALQHPVNKPNYTLSENIHTIPGSIKFMKNYYCGPLKIQIMEKISHSLPESVSTFLKSIYYKIVKK